MVEESETYLKIMEVGYTSSNTKLLEKINLLHLAFTILVTQSENIKTPFALA